MNHLLIHKSCRHGFHIVMACLGIWLLGGSCSSDENEAWSSAQEEDGALIEVQLSTRATNADGDLVTYPDDNLVGTQHASQVMLYIFKGNGDEAEYCGIRENIGWKEHFTANGGSLPDHTTSMTYRLQAKLEAKTSYQFLAVGMNEEGAASFDISLTPLTEQGRQATTLVEAIGQLKSLKSAADIRRSEIYVGTEPYQPENHGATRITLHRRVAAVAGWFTNVPMQVLSPVTPNVVDKQVAKLRLSLYAAQNMALPLVMRRQKPFEDYISKPAAATDAARTTLVEMEVPADAGSKTVIHGGSFMLPIPAPVDKETYTMRLELVNLAGQVLSVRRIKLPKGDDLDHGETGGGTGIIDTESAFRFPIIANHYYGIGKPSQAIDLKGSGTDLVITVDPSWDEEADLELGEKNE